MPKYRPGPHQRSASRRGPGALWLAVLLAFPFILPAEAFAAVYKWVDEKGRVHYGSKPPGNRESKEIRTPAPSQSQPGAVSDTERQRRRKKILEAYEAEREEKAKTKAEQSQIKAKIDAQCKKGRQFLKRADGAPYLYRTDKDGERQTLNDKERSAAVAKVEKFVRKYC